MGRPALPIGTFGKIKTYPTKTGYRARCLYRDYDGKVRSVEKAGRTKAGAEAALKLALRDRGRVVGSGDVTSDTRVRAIAEVWFAGLRDKSPTTMESYRRILDRHVIGVGPKPAGTKFARLYRTAGFDIPALIPQVYLHYDPYTKHELAPQSSPLTRQPMDFLLLFPHRARVVIELDGRHHYADDQGRADPKRYAAMVAEDRNLRLAGYEVYRFGGQELADRSRATFTLGEFFDALLTRHGIALTPPATPPTF